MIWGLTPTRAKRMVLTDTAPVSRLAVNGWPLEFRKTCSSPALARRGRQTVKYSSSNGTRSGGNSAFIAIDAAIAPIDFELLATEADPPDTLMILVQIALQRHLADIALAQRTPDQEAQDERYPSPVGIQRQITGLGGQRVARRIREVTLDGPGLPKIMQACRVKRVDRLADGIDLGQAEPARLLVAHRIRDGQVALEQILERLGNREILEPMARDDFEMHDHVAQARREFAAPFLDPPLDELMDQRRFAEVAQGEEFRGEVLDSGRQTRPCGSGSHETPWHVVARFFTEWGRPGWTTRWHHCR